MPLYLKTYIHIIKNAVILQQNIMQSVPRKKTDRLDASNFLYTDGAFKFNQKNKTTLLMLIFCSG